MDLIDRDQIKAQFVVALNQSIESFSVDKRPELMSFISELIATQIPYVYAMPAYAQRFTDFVFQTNLRRDFLYTLCFNFYSFTPTNAMDFHIMLVDDLAFAASMCITKKDLPVLDSDNSVVPHEVTERLASVSEIRQLLLKEKWICMCLLLSTFITLADITVLSDKQPVAKPQG